MDYILLGPDGLRAGWSLLLYFALLYALYMGTSFVLINLFPGVRVPRGSAMPPRTLLVTEGIVLFCVAAASWIMARIENRPATDYGLRPSRALPNFIIGIFCGVGLLTLLVLALRAAGYLVFDGRLLTTAEALRYGLVWGLGFLIVGLFEETFFRGYIQFTLTRGLAGIFRSLGVANADALGFWSAAAIISIGFGATHGTNTGESPIGLLSVVLIGLVLCFSLWRTGSLWWAVGFHTAWDWAQSFLYGVPDSGNLMQGHLLASHPQGSVLLSGGLTGPEGSLFILAIVPLAAALVALALPRSPSSYLLREHAQIAGTNPGALNLDLP